MKSVYPHFLIILIGMLLAFSTRAQPVVIVPSTPVLNCNQPCATLTAVLSPPFTAANTILSWSGNGIVFPLNVTNPQVCSPGTYVVVATNGTNGLTATAAITITAQFVMPFLSIFSNYTTPCNPNGDNAACEVVCPGQVVTYDAFTSGYVQNWSVYGASTYTVSADRKTITVTWGQAGTGSVAVTAVDQQSGCMAEDSKCITITPEPVAVLQTTPAVTAPGDTLRVCKGQAVWFNGQNSKNAEAYEWFFGDDQSKSPEPAVEHYFQKPGIFEVRLSAKSNCICVSQSRQVVEVLDLVAPQLACFGTVCSGTTVTYRAQPSCPTMSWSVDNGTILGNSGDSLTVQWAGGPAGVLHLSGLSCAGNTCPGPFDYRIPVIDDTAKIEGPGVVCPASRTAYSIQSFGGTGYTWTLSGGGFIRSGQGTPLVEIDWDTVFTSNPVYLKVQYDNCYLGCKGQDVKIIYLQSPLALSGPVELCAGSKGDFKARKISNGQLVPCHWTLLSPTDTVVWTSAAPASTATIPFGLSPGSYRIRAVPANPALTCSEEVDWRVRVQAPPAPLSGIGGDTLICAGEGLTYAALGNSPGNLIRWQVQNGPGAALADKGESVNVVWSAQTPRTLSATQVSADGLGCVSTPVTLTIQHMGPVAVQGPDELCIGAVETFTAINPGNRECHWSIQPADAGVITKGQGKDKVDIFWQQPGTHQIVLEVCGQISTTPVLVRAAPEPIVLHPAGQCPGDVGTVQTADPYTAYTWGDADNKILSMAAKVELGAGDFALTVTDPYGCTGTGKFNIEQYPVPNLSVTTADPTGFCANSLNVHLHALTTVDGDYTFDWFKDGSYLDVHTPTYTTNQYGLYSARATNTFGCTAYGGPIWLFEHCGGVCYGSDCPPVCPPGSIGMQISPTASCDSFGLRILHGANYLPGSAAWQLGPSGGGQVGLLFGDTVAFRFPNAGKYIAILYAKLTNNALCAVVDSMEVEVAAQFTSEIHCPGEKTLFTETSTFVPGSGITNWQWTFGDPASGPDNTGIKRHPAHTYQNGGQYPVRLTITANSGCTSSVTVPLDIPDIPPPVSIQAKPGCSTDAVPMSVPVSPGVLEYLWDFGDPASSATNTANGPSVFHRFSAPGTYTVTLVRVNALGCTAVQTTEVIVPPLVLNGSIAPAGPLFICPDASLTLTAPAGAVAYRWSDASTGVSLPVSTTGVYSVTLTDNNGCTYVPPPVSVKERERPAAVIKAALTNELGQVTGTVFPALGVCLGEDVQLQVSGGGIYSYQWPGFLYGTSVVFSNEHGNFLSVGTHTYVVTITEPATGCTAVTDPFVVTVHPVPALPKISGTDKCATNGPVTISLTGVPQPGLTYAWSTGDKGTVLTTSDPGSYLLQATNAFGCSARSGFWQLLPGPDVRAIPSGCNTHCRPDTLCLPAMPGVKSWQWYRDGVPIPGATGSGYVATQSGTYWAKLLDFYGCSGDSDPLTLNLYDGYGHILGQVWNDLNDNGVIDAGDMLVNGIPVQLWQNGVPAGQAESNAGGDFAFANVVADTYAVQINPALLPPGWEIVIGQDSAQLQGCDAQAQVALLVKAACLNTLSGTLDLFACPGGVALYNGSSIPVGATQTFQLTTAQGCDSVLTVHVNPLAVSTGTLDVQACPGTSYDYNGTAIPAGSSQQFTLVNAAGCDSVLTVNVGTLPVSTGILNVKVCPGTSYDYNGTAVPAGSSQQFTLVNALGCDSVLTVNVGALPVSTGVLNAKVCPGTSYDYNGTAVPAGTSQQFTLVNALGCDSVLTVNVGTLPVSTGILNVNVCPGTSYDYNGTAIPAGSSQQFTLVNAVGCDSVLTVNVGTLPVSTGILNVKVCPGTSYDYNGTAVPAGSSQQFTLVNALGCDSVLTVNVGTLPVSTGILNVNVCPGTSYDYNGTAIPAGSSQQFTLVNAVGCDSVLTVNVGTLPVSTGILNVKVCPGTSYDYNGTAVPAGSSQQFTLVNAAGCDSVLTVNVGTLAPSEGTLNVSVCPDSSYVYNGVSIPAGLGKQFILTNAAGCDSVLTVIVSTVPVIDHNWYAKVCPGESYVYNGVPVAGGTSRQFHFISLAGCDSLVTVTVGLLAPTTGVLNVKACPGTNYLYNGTPIPAGTSQQFTLVNAAGCDSVLTVNVGTLAATTGTLNVKACPGTNYLYNGTPIPAGASQQFTLVNAAGCDSVLTVNVGTLAATTGTLNVKACPGTNYLYNGTPIPAGASQQFTLVNAAGCDSVLTVNVGTLAATTGTLNVSACPGTGYVYNGNTIPAGTSQQFHLLNAAGCDSLLTVTVNTLAVTSGALDVSVCPGETYTLHGVTLGPGESHSFHLINSEGCDSVLVLTISAYPETTFELASEAACPGANTGSLSVVDPAGGLPPYRYALDGSQFQDEPQFDGLPAGAYSVWLEDGHGCRFRRDAAIPAREPLGVQLDDAELPCDSGVVLLRPLVSGDLSGLRYAWSTGAQTPEIAVTDAGPVWVEVGNDCETLRRDIVVDWAGDGEGRPYVYVPNTFAPAAALPGNAVFRPQFAQGLTITDYRLEVYDRWGNLLFRTHDPEAGWAGPFRQQDMKPAVFVWLLSMDIWYCGGQRHVEKYGDVTVVR